MSKVSKALASALSAIVAVAVALEITTPVELQMQWVQLMWSGLGAFAVAWVAPANKP